jgi:hypothetical protein
MIKSNPQRSSGILEEQRGDKTGIIKIMPCLGEIPHHREKSHPFYQLFKMNRYAKLDLDGAPRASQWSPITLPDYANER